TRRLTLRDFNWIGPALEGDLSRGVDLFAKVRSTRPPRPARLYRDDDGLRVALADGEAGIAAGQACVLYSDDGEEARVFGGGFIARAEREAAAERQLAQLSAQAS